MTGLFDRIFSRVYPQRYKVFMLACLLLIFAAMVPKSWQYEGMVISGVFSFHVLSGTVLWYQAKSRMAVFFFYLGLSLAAMQFLDALNVVSLGSILPGLYILFFVAVSGKIYRDIFAAKEIDIKMLLAVFTGLILLGIMATFAFVAIERIMPGSFRGMDPALTLFDNLLYFSFISLLTIGYGDMVPATSLTKILSVVVGLIGNFYTIIVTGIVIGKYLSNPSKSSDKES